MPTKCGLKDSKGYFCRWGGHGAKYYYDPNDNASKERARAKANAQGAAAHAGGYTGKAADDLTGEQLLQMELDLENKKSEDGDRKKVPNPDESGDEAEPEEWKKSIVIPKSVEEIKENSYIIHKGKIAKIVKVLEK